MSYTYCADNPVMDVDDDGQMPKWLKWLLIVAAAVIVTTVTVITGGGAIIAGGAAIGFVSGIGTSAVSQYTLTGTIDIESMFLDGLVGMISGALAMTPISFAGSVFAGSLIGAGASVADDFIHDRVVNPLKMLGSAAFGAISGAISGAGLNIKGKITKADYLIEKRLTAFSPKKIAQYTRGLQSIKKSIVTSGFRAFWAIEFSQTWNSIVYYLSRGKHLWS